MTGNTSSKSAKTAKKATAKTAKPRKAAAKKAATTRVSAKPALLSGATRRAIDLHEGDKIDEKALKALIRAALALNTSLAG